MLHKLNVLSHNKQLNVKNGDILLQSTHDELMVLIHTLAVYCESFNEPPKEFRKVLEDLAKIHEGYHNEKLSD